MIHAVLFDLDGTLTDPKEGITRCMQYALAQLGRDVPPTESLIPYIGPPLQETFARLLATDDPARVDAAIAHYRKRFASTGMYENSVYPGTAAMLAALKAAGMRLFVATSKPRVFAVKILEHFDLARYFDGVYGSELDGRLSDKGELIAEVLRAEGLDPATALMVGDRAHDVIGARHNGVRSVVVSYGYASAAELDSHAPDLRVATPAALAAAVIEERRNGAH